MHPSRKREKWRNANSRQYHNPRSPKKTFFALTPKPFLFFICFLKDINSFIRASLINPHPQVELTQLLFMPYQSNKNKNNNNNTFSVFSFAFTYLSHSNLVSKQSRKMHMIISIVQQDTQGSKICSHLPKVTQSQGAKGSVIQTWRLDSDFTPNF